MADCSFLVVQRLVQGLGIVLRQSLAIVLAIERGQDPSQRAFLQQGRGDTGSRPVVWTFKFIVSDLRA